MMAIPSQLGDEATARSLRRPLAMKHQPPVCQQCQQQEGKYKMPGTEFFYCSVPCYKALKVALRTPEAPPHPEPSTSATKVNEEPAEETLEAPRLLKRLRDLDWPEEPDSSFWADPLKRDELKPLRNFELEAVATNAELRKMLKEHPNLPALLQQAFSDPAMPPNVFLRHVMGISTASATSAAPQNYRGRGRGGRGMRGQTGRGRGRGGAEQRGGRTGGGQAAPAPSPETVQLMHKFADLVKTALAQAREARG